MSSRADLFAAGAAKRNSNQSEVQTNRGGGDFEYPDREPIFSTALTIKPAKTGFKQIRMLGNPIEARNDDPFSPRVIHTSMIKGDDGKKFRCIWPGKNDDPNWILWKIYNKIMSFTYNKTKGEREYHLQNTHPDLFNRVFKNDDLDNNLESGWRPKASVIMNVIDRDFMEWHRENQTTVLLSRKGSPMEDGNIFYEPGFPPTVYNGVWDTIVAWAGDWETYDVVIEIVGADPWYRVYHPTENRRSLEASNKFQIYEEYAERELTEEEQSWNRINLDEVFHVTSPIKIENRLGVFIQRVDKELGTKFYPELKEQAETTRKEMEARRQEAEKQAVGTGDNPVQSAPTEEPSTKNTDEGSTTPTTEQPIRKRTRKPVSEGSPAFDLDAYAETYPGVNKLTDEEREVIVGFDSENEKFLFKEGTYSELYFCPGTEEGNCTMDSPDWFHVCPGCGIVFEE